jgi:hypothetical protein
MFSYDLTDEDYELPYNAPGKSGSYFALDDHFGRGYPSRRSDGVKLQTILGNSGDIDLERVGGPTGWGTETLDRGIRSFQKRNGLKVDGWVRPGGPTIAKMNEQFGGLLGDYEAPTPKQADTNLRLRDAGQEGFLKGKRQDLMLPPIPGLPKPDDDILGANRSLTRHLRDNGFQLRDTPAYMAKRVQTGKQDGVIEARDFVDQLDQLRPGTGTKAVRGILHALAATPQLQRAFFGGPVIETAPFGVFEPGGPARYEEAIRTRPWEPQNESSGLVQPMGDRPEYDPVTGKWTLRDPVTGARRPASPHEIMNRPPVMHLGDAIEPAQDEVEVENVEVADDEIESEATATDYAGEDPETLLVAQAQPPQPGQQPRPAQNQNRQPQPAPQPARPQQNQNRQPQPAPQPARPQQNPPRQGQDRIPQPPRLAPRRDGDPQAQPPAQAEPAPQQPQAPAPAQPARRPVRAEWRAPSTAFRTNIAVAEGGGERESPWDAVNPSTGAMGRYQLTHGALIDARLKSSRAADGWATGNPLGIRTDAELRGNRQAQEKAFEAVMRRNHAQLVQNGAYGTLNQRIQGIEAEFQVTQSGLMAAAHRRGARAVADYLHRMSENNWNSSEAIRGLSPENGAAHREVEKRLKDFVNVR